MTASLDTITTDHQHAMKTLKEHRALTVVMTLSQIGMTACAYLVGAPTWCLVLGVFCVFSNGVQVYRVQQHINQLNAMYSRIVALHAVEKALGR